MHPLVVAAAFAAQYPGVESPREPLPAGVPRGAVISRVYSEWDPHALLAKTSQ